MQAFLDIVLPVFAIVGVGYACGRLRLLGPGSSEALNGFVYWVALPALMFQVMAEVDLATIYNPAFILGFSGALIATWAIAGVVGLLIFRLSVAEASMHGLNGAYPNSGYMGIPLAIAAFGEDAALPAIVAAIISVLSITLGVIPIEFSRREKTRFFEVIGKVALAIITNPMIVAPFAALIWAATGLGLAEPVARFTGLLGAAAGPCALIAIGLFLVDKPITEGSFEVGLMTFSKLILHPLLTGFALLVLFPTEPLWAIVGILLAALPIGSGPFVLAQAQGVYPRRTSTAMLVTTVVSIVTVSGFFLVFPAAP